jgi:hypothetical protein
MAIHPTKEQQMQPQTPTPLQTRTIGHLGVDWTVQRVKMVGAYAQVHVVDHYGEMHMCVVDANGQIDWKS